MKLRHWCITGSLALASAFAKSVLGGDADVLRTMRELGWELFGSLTRTTKARIVS